MHHRRSAHSSSQSRSRARSSEPIYVNTDYNHILRELMEFQLERGVHQVRADARQVLPRNETDSALIDSFRERLINRSIDKLQSNMRGHMERLLRHSGQRREVEAIEVAGPSKVRQRRESASNSYATTTPPTALMGDRDSALRNETMSYGDADQNTINSAQEELPFETEGIIDGLSAYLEPTSASGPPAAASSSSRPGPLYYELVRDLRQSVKLDMRTQWQGLQTSQRVKVFLDQRVPTTNRIGQKATDRDRESQGQVQVSSNCPCESCQAKRRQQPARDGGSSKFQAHLAQAKQASKRTVRASAPENPFWVAQARQEKLHEIHAWVIKAQELQAKESHFWTVYDHAQSKREKQFWEHIELSAENANWQPRSRAQSTSPGYYDLEDLEVQHYLANQPTTFFSTSQPNLTTMAAVATAERQQMNTTLPSICTCRECVRAVRRQ